MTRYVIHAFNLHGQASSQDQSDRAALKAWIRECVATTGGWERQFSARIGIALETVQNILNPIDPAYPTPAFLECVTRAWRIPVPDAILAAAKRELVFAPIDAYVLRRAPSRASPPAAHAKTTSSKYTDIERKAEAQLAAQAKRRLRPDANDECFTLRVPGDVLFRAIAPLPLQMSQVPRLMGGNYSLPDGHRAALIDDTTRVQLVNVGIALCQAIRKAGRPPAGYVELRFNNRTKQITFA